jgi:hypothetical protein
MVRPKGGLIFCQKIRLLTNNMAQNKDKSQFNIPFWPHAKNREYIRANSDYTA